MPRYFFNVTDRPDYVDDVGEELDNINKAKCHAVKYAGHLICDSSEVFWDTNDWQMTVSDEAGLTLFVLMFVGYEAPSAMTFG